MTTLRFHIRVMVKWKFANLHFFFRSVSNKKIPTSDSQQTGNKSQRSHTAISSFSMAVGPGPNTNTNQNVVRKANNSLQYASKREIFSEMSENFH